VPAGFGCVGYIARGGGVIDQDLEQVPGWHLLEDGFGSCPVERARHPEKVDEPCLAAYHDEPASIADRPNPRDRQTADTQMIKLPEKQSESHILTLSRTGR
jgi:hypothetical protein